MIKRIAALFIILAMLPWQPVSAAEDSVTTTVMIYMCGSNLESAYGLATGDINEIIAARPTKRITNVVLMTGGSSSWTFAQIDPTRTDIYQIRGNSPASLLPGTASVNMNMGQSDTLSFFLNTAYEKCPADRYMLILWNHGGGPIGGVCLDENYDDDSLTLPEIITALDNSPFRDRKLDLIGFDACLMGSVEIAWQMAPYANYMVASEEREPGSGWNYSFLTGMEHDDSPIATARRIIDTYIDTTDPEKGANLTLSCIDLSKMEAVVSCMDRFFTDLNDLMDQSVFLDMSSLRHYAQGYGRDYRAAETVDYDLVDITSLLNAFDRYALPSAEALRTALQEAVVYTRSTLADSYGLSVYFPYFNLGSYSEAALNLYDTLNFCPGYAQYIRTFQDYMTSDSLVDWCNLIPQVTRDGDGFLVGLNLTDEQQRNMVSAKLVIFESQYSPDSSNAFYSRVYGSVDVTIDESGRLSAPYHDEYLAFNYQTANGINAFSGSISFLLLDSGEYRLPVMAANIKPEYISLAQPDEPGVSHLMQITLTRPDENGLMHFGSVQGYDSVTNTFTTRMDDSPTEYEYLHFVTNPRLLQRRNGLLLPYELWPTQADGGVSVYENDPVRTDGTLSFQFKQETTDAVRYAAFEITDGQNNTFTTELTPLRPPEEVTLYQETIPWVDSSLDVTLRVVATSKFHLLIQLEVENHADNAYSFHLSDFLLNDKSKQVSSAADSTWLIAPGEKSSIPMTYALDDIWNYGKVIRNCTFVLELNHADGSYAGSTQAFSYYPAIDFSTLMLFFH